MKAVIFWGVSFFLATTAGAQTVENLVAPLWMRSVVPGAHGSLWTTEMTIFNSGDDSVVIGESTESCRLPEGCGDTATVIEPGETLEIQPRITPAYEVMGRMLYVVSESGAVGDLEMNLRIFDLSRQSETYGVELPLLEQHDFQETVTLVKVPLGGSFRQAIRIYAWNLGVGDFVQLDLIDVNTGSTLATETLPVERTALTPGYAQVVDLVNRYPQLAGHEAVRARVTPVQVTSQGTEPRLIWAFASVTHDETQHVTTITPQP